MPKYEMTLCWNCANATGNCPWSSSLEPVEGWVAIETKKNTYSHEYGSYLVQQCPLFKRDAYMNGLKRYKEGDTICGLKIE